MSTEYGGRGNRQGSISARELRGDTRSRRTSGWGGVAFLGVLLLIIVGGAVVVLGPVYKDFAFNLARTNPQAMRLPMVPDVIRERLGDSLRTPADAGDDDPVSFVVPVGASIESTGQALTDAGLIADPLVFVYHAVTKGIDDELQVGSFSLMRSMSPGDIAARLALPPDPIKPKIVLAFRVALRLEQMAAYLETRKTVSEDVPVPLEMDVAAFLELVRNPTQELRDEYPALREIPKGRTLEGFMGQGVFEVDTDITPDALVKLLLDDWQEDIGLEVIEQAKRQDQDFYDVVTVASLVERETGEDSERDKVAGVYLNRLDPSRNPTGIMNADPTVIYAVDTMWLNERTIKQWTKYLFWDVVGRALLRVNVDEELQSFQTYQNPGLPDWPIATPSKASIEAVLKPDTRAGNLFFYACPGSTTHVFAKTLAEQQRNIDSCKPVKTPRR